VTMYHQADSIIIKRVLFSYCNDPLGILPCQRELNNSPLAKRVGACDVFTYYGLIICCL